MAWLLIALFLCSAGHGIFLHADHEHEAAPQNCAFCVLGWPMVIAAAVTAIAVRLQASTFRSPRGVWIRRTAFAYSRSQRAPPR
jgi:hypothetical protein